LTKNSKIGIPQLWLSNKNQSGFTLIECLLAIIVVAILLSAVAPVIVLSIATRLQARRVELASQASQTYIDGVRAGKIQASLINPVPLNEVSVDTVTGKRTFTADRATFAANLPPASSELNASNCLTTNPLYPYCNTPTSTLYCVDLDGGGCSNSSSRDLIVQAFRSQSSAQALAEGSAANSNDLNRIINKNGFLLGVRVYRADSFQGGRTLIGGKGEKDKTFTGGTGLKNLQAPLVEVTTEISARGSSSGEATDTTSYTDMCARLGGCNPTP
jgi:prepilin-type N-terminal cleavage/methylation domain-containing protein